LYSEYVYTPTKTEDGLGCRTVLRHSPLNYSGQK
jgi:hypothetical protein